MALELTVRLVNLLEQWEAATPRPTGEALVELLANIARTFEYATGLYLKEDPDPFDTRHPSRANPDSALGHMLKKIYKNDAFISAVLEEYLSTHASLELQTVTCRLLLDLLPGVNPSVFRDSLLYILQERVVRNLILWTERSPNPLQSYALGVLAIMMDDENIASKFKEQNACLVAVLLERLQELNRQYFKIKHSPKKDYLLSDRPFAHLNMDSREPADIPGSSNAGVYAAATASESNESNNSALAPVSAPMPAAEFSNSSWSDMESLMIGTYQVYPLTIANEQRYILQYLATVGSYQELHASVFEEPSKILSIVISYVDLKQHTNVRLAFDALRYLGILMFHKKFASEFVTKIGVHHLLKVHRPSLAATGVSFVLYYLSTSEDAMQKVCLLPHAVVWDLVAYALWLLECSHSSGRAHTTMFFECAFSFSIIRDLFAEQDGMRKLLNCVGTLDIVVRNIVRDVPGILKDDDVATGRHICRHAVLALRKYFEAYVDTKAAALRQAQPSSSRATAYKKSLEENVETLVALLPVSSTLDPVEQILKLDGIHFLLKLIVMHFGWSYGGKLDTVRSALDILFVCSVCDRVKLALCEAVHYVTPNQSPCKKIGMTIILQCAVGEKIPDYEIRRAALNIIVNCVAGPVVTKQQVADSLRAGVRYKNSRGNEDILHKVWNCFRSTNGIMLLRMLLTTKAPVMGADAIRALACQALCGLARCSKVMQILSKLQLFTSGQLHVLMREPVLRDKRQEHAKFVKYCTKLIEMITGGTSVQSELSISKAEIVAQTVITYDQQQLLKLICEHLKERGLNESAAMLNREARLDIPIKSKLTPLCSNGAASADKFGPVNERTPVSSHCSVIVSSSSAHTPPTMKRSSVFQSSPFQSEDAYKSGTSVICQANSVHSTVDKQLYGPTPPKRQLLEFHSPRILTNPTASATSEVYANGDQHLQTHPLNLQTDHHTPAITVRKILTPKSRKSLVGLQRLASYSTSATATSSSISYSRAMSLKKQTLFSAPSLVDSARRINLDTIVSDYLRSQHGFCKTPYITCPPFDLFMPHQCPEPRYQNVAPSNIALRCMQKVYTPRYWGRFGSSMSRKFLNSKFRDVHSFLDPYGSTMSQCAFASLEGNLYIGTYSGELRIFGIKTGREVHSFNCHETEITNIQCLKKSPLFLTSAEWRRPVTALWDASNGYQLVYIFQDECYAEFSKMNRDCIIATKHDRAQIYDLQTGNLVTTFSETNLGNSYRLNRATFNHSDELVLSDGVIWDVNSQKPIHKLDKFNPRINGVFHPNGLEIVSNSEVWDMRTYRLLRTVPELEQSKLVFDQTGDIIYGAILAPEIDHDNSCFKKYGSSFRTFDGTDYSCITTRDVQKGINDIAISPDDRYLSVLQNPFNESLFGASESRCHIYEIGRIFEDDDVDGINDEEENPQQQQSDDDDDDDDDDEDEEEQDDDDDDDEQDNGDGQENDNELDHGLNDDDDDDNDDDQNSIVSYSGSEEEELYFSFRA